MGETKTEPKTEKKTETETAGWTDRQRLFSDPHELFPTNSRSGALFIASIKAQTPAANQRSAAQRSFFAVPPRFPTSPRLRSPQAGLDRVGLTRAHPSQRSSRFRPLDLAGPPARGGPISPAPTRVFRPPVHFAREYSARRSPAGPVLHFAREYSARRSPAGPVLHFAREYSARRSPAGPVTCDGLRHT